MTLGAFRHTSPSQGFTLIELAVVLVLMGVALAVVSPSLPRPRTGTEGAARHLRGVIEEGRRLASIQGGEARVTVDVRTGAYRLYRRAEGSAVDSLVRSGRLEGWAESAGSRGDPIMVVRIDALGKAEGVSPAWRGADGRSAKVMVNPWTGRVDEDVR